MDYFQECIKKFRAMPEYIRMAVGSDVAVRFINKLGEKYNNIDLKFIVILITIGELRLDDLPEYLNLKFKLLLEEGEEIENQLRESVFYGIEDLITVEEDWRNRKIDMKTIKEEVLKYFEKGVEDDIKSPKSFGENRDINDKILIVIYEEEDQKEVEKALYRNNEEVTSASIMFDGKLVKPSVGNWIRDFIKNQGSDIFDIITLSKYIINSPNTKKMSEEEKKRIERLLTIYRNLKFFPESLDGVSGKEPEIIVSKKESSEVRQSLATPKSPEEQEIETLEKMAAGYALGSLERRAVEEEIRKMKLSIRYQGIKK